jgi:hypothetical protein
LKPFITKPAFLISFAVAIPTSAPTSFSTFTPILTILMVFAPALAEPILLSTPKIAAALSLATCILTVS